jgi:hypothetical protein
MSDSTSNTTAAGAKGGDTLRAKWTMDGATTLQEAASRLEVLAAHLRNLHDQGWTLVSPVEDDYGILRDPQGDAGDSEAEDGDPQDTDSVDGQPVADSNLN